MKKIKLMILGAGIYQVPLIKTAKDMGYTTVVVSPKGDYPGIELADYFIDSDTKNKEYILKKSKELNISGIVTTGTDVAVPTIGYVVDNLNLLGTKYKAACRSMDKTLMKKYFIQHNVNTAKFHIVTSLEKLKIKSFELGYPVIVKAVDTSGSRGITKVNNENELSNAYQYAKSVTNKSEIIVEEYLEGIEIGAQAIVVGKEVTNIFIHSDEVTPPPISVPIGHAMPIELTIELEIEIKKLIKKAIEALGIENTISNVDIMIVDNIPYILEIGARMGATCLAENISIYGGFNAYEVLIKLALGEEVFIDKNSTKQANAALLLQSNKSGIIKKIDINKEIFNNPCLVNLSIDVKVGDRVNKFKVGPDRIGQIITIGDTQKEAIDLANFIKENINFEVE